MSTDTSALYRPCTTETIMPKGQTGPWFMRGADTKVAHLLLFKIGNSMMIFHSNGVSNEG